MKLEIGQIWKHLERGTIYGIYGFTTLQVEGPDDDAEAVTYRDLCEPAKSWTRPITTFLDGRFVCLDPVTAAEEIWKIVIAEMLKKLDLSGFTGGGSVSKDEFIHGSTEANLILHSEKIVTDRKIFFLDLKENDRGKFIKITEDVRGRRDTIILPIDAAQEFLDAMMRTVDAASVDE